MSFEDRIAILLDGEYVKKVLGKRRPCVRCSAVMTIRAIRLMTGAVAIHTAASWGLLRC